PAAEHRRQLRLDQREHQREQHEQERDGEEVLRDVPPRIDHVPHEAAFRAPMLERHLALVAGHEGLLGLRPLAVGALAVTATGLLAGVDHQWLPTGRLGLLARTGGTALRTGSLGLRRGLGALRGLGVAEDHRSSLADRAWDPALCARWHPHTYSIA